MTFNQRRKTIRNSLKSFLKGKDVEHHFLTLRPEVLSVEDFIELTQLVEKTLSGTDLN
jgi:16S rRNA (adenine1518-N6/adenine1519-N6)-dimethyltransferase